MNARQASFDVRRERRGPSAWLLAVALLGAMAAAGCASAPRVQLDTSHLPVFLIETGGRSIPDEPKVPARLRVVTGGYGGPSAAAAVSYEGPVGIERRGSSSQARYPKPQFGIELRDAGGDRREVPLLGLPEDDDWVLHGPYGDKSLVRNALAFWIARRMGRYASRSRFCEVVLDGEYLGVYVLLERVKRARDRIDIRRLRPDDRGPRAITGGYVFKLDKDPEGGWRSPYPGRNGEHPVYVAHDPKPDDLSPSQAMYLASAVTAFEETMASDGWDDPEDGYAAHLDVESFVDYFLLTELSRNVDGYRVSAYFHKDHIGDGGKIRAGPVWDFNIAFGNADYYGGAETSGWQVDLVPRGGDYPVPAWWPRLVREPRFRTASEERWRSLRAGPLHPDSLDATVDDLVSGLHDAPARNFARWPVLGRRVWPNPAVAPTYADEIANLKGWLRSRAAWIDRALPLLR